MPERQLTRWLTPGADAMRAKRQALPDRRYPADIACMELLPALPAFAQGKPILAFVTNASACFWTVARPGATKADGELPDCQAEYITPVRSTMAWSTVPKARERVEGFRMALQRGNITSVDIRTIRSTLPRHATKSRIC